MRSFMAHLAKVLTSSSAITSLVPRESISPSVRQPAGTTAIEFDISEGIRDRQGKCPLTVRLYLHATSANLAHSIADAVHAEMTAAKLSDRNRADGPFVVSQSKNTLIRREPRNEWAASLLVEYSIKLVELDGIRQNQ